MTDPLDALVRATLYEGYVLWPYTRSSRKNQRRFTFGGVYPVGFCEEAAERDRHEIRCEVLLEGDARTRVDLELRFLHVVRREVLARDGARLRAVDRLECGGQLFLAWDEAAERRLPLGTFTAGALSSGPRDIALVVPAGSLLEDLCEPDGSVAGALRRSWESVEARAHVALVQLAPRLLQLTVVVANASAWRGRERETAQRRSLLSTHLVLRADEGAFHSLADPPDELAAEAARCRNEGVWPALVGDEGSRTTVLASPLVLADHARIAPESSGDLFDASEIDQLLLLNVLALGDAEKREMAATDPRARAILERAEALDVVGFRRLHGVFREPGGAR